MGAQMKKYRFTLNPEMGVGSIEGWARLPRLADLALMNVWRYDGPDATGGNQNVATINTNWWKAEELAKPMPTAVGTVVEVTGDAEVGLWTLAQDGYWYHAGNDRSLAGDDFAEVLQEEDCTWAVYSEPVAK